MSYLLAHLPEGDYLFSLAGRVDEPDPMQYGCSGYILVHLIDEKGNVYDDTWYAFKILDETGGQFDLEPVMEEEVILRIEQLKAIAG